MKCYEDEFEMGVLDAENRYCPRCGARLFQECPYCSEGNSVFDTNCKKCGRPFVYCPTCHILYGLDKPCCDNLLHSEKLDETDSENPCGSLLSEHYLGYYAPLANLERTNVVRATEMDSILPVTPLSPTEGLQMSAAVTRHGWLFFGTRTAGPTGQGRIRAFSLRTEKDMWTGSPLRSQSLWDAEPTAYQRYIVTRSGQIIFVDSVLTGKEVAQISTSLTDYHEAVVGNVLLLLGKDDHGRQVLQGCRLGSPLSAAFETKEIERTPSINSYMALPVVTDDYAFFVDLQNRVIRCTAAGEFKVIWDNPSQFYISQMVLMNGEMFLLTTDRQTYSLLSLPGVLTPDAQGSVKTRLAKLSLQIPVFALYQDLAIFAAPDSLQAYRLTRPNQPLWQFSLLSNSTVTDFFVVAQGDTLYVVYVLRQNNPNQFSVRFAQVGDLVAGSTLQILLLNSRPWIMYAAGQVLSCDRSQGRIYRAKFPV